MSFGYQEIGRKELVEWLSEPTYRNKQGKFSHQVADFTPTFNAFITNSSITPQDISDRQNMIAYLSSDLCTMPPSPHI
jgi:hypothetical protein